MGIQANTAILLYHKLRLVIAHHLSLEAHQLFEGEIELDESILAVDVKASVVVVQVVRQRYLVS